MGHTHQQILFSPKFTKKFHGTYENNMMREYCEFLCGDRVWGFVVKGPNNAPMSCPSLNMVLDYDMALQPSGAVAGVEPEVSRLWYCLRILCSQ